MEQRFYLNKSETKMFLIGINPNMTGDFAFEMRLACSKDKYLAFSGTSIMTMFSLVHRIIEHHGKTGEGEIVAENDWMMFKPIDHTADVYQLSKKPTFFEPKVDENNRIEIEFSSLQRLHELSHLIALATNTIRNPAFVKKTFFSLVEEARKLPNKNIENLREFLLEKLRNRSDVEEVSPFYIITYDTLAHFEQYFKFFVQKTNNSYKNRKIK